MATTLYVVVATTGSHSCGRDWWVAAYHQEDVAWLHAQKANEYMRACHEAYYDPDGDMDYDAHHTRCAANPWDAQAEMNDSDGTHYTVETVQLLLHPDQYLEEVTKADG